MMTVIGKSSVGLFTEEEVKKVLDNGESPLNPNSQPIDELIVDPEINGALIPFFEQATEQRRTNQAEITA